MVSGGMKCVKCLLFVFNKLFVLSGIIILTIGALILHVYGGYSTFVSDKLYTAPVILIIVGAIIFIVAFFGCCGALKENHCMVVTFAVLLLGIFCLELVGGIIGYVYKDNAKQSLEEHFNASILKYYNDKTVERSWNMVQSDLECCGIHGYKDWRAINDTIPSTCCRNAEAPCTAHDAAERGGCLDSFHKLVEHYAVTIMGVGIGIAFVQLVGVIFACCLAKSIREEFETV